MRNLTLLVFGSLFALLTLISCNGGEEGGNEINGNTVNLTGAWKGIMSPGFYINFEIQNIGGKAHVTSANGQYAVSGCDYYLYNWEDENLQVEVKNNKCDIYFPDNINYGDGRGMELHIQFESASELRGTWVGETFCEPLIDGTFVAYHCVDNDKDGALFCSFPPGMRTESDCNDENSSIFRNAVEICDGLDNDCDGTVDNVSFADGETYGDEILLYPDVDGDGFGNAKNAGRIICGDVYNGIDYVLDNSDCDDTNPNVNPDQDEICRNDIDDNCSRDQNENCIATTLNVPEEYSTIQSAIDLAADGDTILVSEGNYIENLDFLGKPITLLSESGPEITIIDGNDGAYSTKPVVSFTTCEDRSAIIDGFTLTDGLHGILVDSPSSCEASPIIKDCIILDNGTDTTSTMDQTIGGGIYMTSNSSPLVVNCIIAHNHAHLGGGIYVGGSATIMNSTIVNNASSYQTGGLGNNGGGIYHLATPGTSLTVVNSILWDNSRGPCGYDLSTHTVKCGESQIYTEDESLITVIASDVKNGFAGEGVIDTDPLLDDAYHLQEGSDCIDNGTDDISTYPEIPTTDIDGQERPRDTGYDIGADEF